MASTQSKTYEKIGNEKLATKFYEEGSKFLTTYYGQLSFQKIKFSPQKCRFSAFIFKKISLFYHKILDEQDDFFQKIPGTE